MEWSATLKHARITPRKARLVADLVRGKYVEDAISVLRFTKRRGAGLILKVIQSAVANATQSAGVEEEKLYISHIAVDDGPRAKRWMPRAMGRATRVLKRTSHIGVRIAEE